MGSKMKLNLYITQCTEMNSKWNKDLMKKDKMIKPLKDYQMVENTWK